MSAAVDPVRQLAVHAASTRCAGVLVHAVQQHQAPLCLSPLFEPIIEGQAGAAAVVTGHGCCAALFAVQLRLPTPAACVSHSLRDRKLWFQPHKLPAAAATRLLWLRQLCLWLRGSTTACCVVLPCCYCHNHSNAQGVTEAARLRVLHKLINSNTENIVDNCFLTHSTW